MQAGIEQGLQFLNGAVLYYGILLGRSVGISVVVLLWILLLRSTLFQKAVFLKGLLWTMLIPVPFMGRLKLFYEQSVIAKPFRWWQEFCINNIWFCYLYVGVAVAFGVRLLMKRKGISRYIKTLDCTWLGETMVYVSELDMTPFVFGVLHPKIVLPDTLLHCLDAAELQTILLHEQVHIRQGHLAGYLLWDLEKILLWMNPLYAVCTGCFHSDLEDICDKTAIRKSGNDAYHYGKVLLKSIRCLRADGMCAPDITAFAGHDAYQRLRRRIVKISAYRPYRQKALRGMVLLTGLVVAALLTGIYRNSYKHCNAANVISLFNVTDHELLVVVDIVEQTDIFAFDDQYLSIDTTALAEMIRWEDYEGKEFGIQFDSYYKIPGIGLGGEMVFVKQADLMRAECKLPYQKTKEPLFVKLLKLI